MRRSIVGDALSVVVALGILAAVAAMVRRDSGAPNRATDPYERHSIKNGSGLARAGHTLGDSSAPIKVVEFSDFQCPYCRRLQQTLGELQARYPGEVAVVYRHYPLPIHARALPAAIASECAARQGRFEPYATLLFANQDSLGIISWEALAARAGIADTNEFKHCRSEPKTRARVDEDITAGSQLGITGTPVIVVRNRMAVGAMPLDTLERFLLSATGRPSLAH